MRAISTKRSAKTPTARAGPTLFHGPYDDFADYEKWAVGAEASRDPQFYAIVDAASGRAVGTCAYMRIEPKHGVIEIGNIYFSPRLGAYARGHRGDVSADGECLRSGISPLRVEMRQLQPAVARRGHAFRLHVRRAVPPGHRQQGPQSRHHLVRHHRPATGTAACRTPIYAGSILPISTRPARRSASCPRSRRRSCTTGSADRRKTPRACRRAPAPSGCRGSRSRAPARVV